MPTNDISQWVKDMLAVAGFDTDNTEQKLYETLYHEYMAVKLFEMLKDEDKKTVMKTERLVRLLFDARFNLKDNKKKTKENKENTPTPLKENKENPKEKIEKTSHTHKKSVRQDLEERKKAFDLECQSFADRYDTEDIKLFFTYWSMQRRKGGKMRFEKERFWDTEGKLKMWVNSRFAVSEENAKLMLEETKKRSKKQTETIEQQQAVAAIREQADARREKAQEESKQGRMLTADYLAQNPDGLMAKWARERKRDPPPTPPCDGGE